MGGSCGASSDAPALIPARQPVRSALPDWRQESENHSIRKQTHEPCGPSATHSLKSTAPPGLDDAAQSRQAALVNLLRLVAGAPDLGAPTEEVLDGTFSAQEYLAADAERLYAAAERRTRP